MADEDITVSIEVVNEMTVEAWSRKRLEATAEQIAQDLERAAASIRSSIAVGPSARLVRPYAHLVSEVDRALSSAWSNFPIAALRDSALEAEIDRAARNGSQETP